MKITKQFKFDAGHRLMLHTGKCHNLHGHEYCLDVSIVGELDKYTGMVIDFSDLKPIVSPAIENMDHAMILNIEDRANIDHCLKHGYKMYSLKGEPTAENIALHFLNYICRRIKTDTRVWKVLIRLSETSTSYVEVARDMQVVEV